MAYAAKQFNTCTACHREYSKNAEHRDAPGLCPSCAMNIPPLTDAARKRLHAKVREVFKGPDEFPDVPGIPKTRATVSEQPEPGLHPSVAITAYLRRKFDIGHIAEGSVASDFGWTPADFNEVVQAIDEAAPKRDRSKCPNLVALRAIVARAAGQFDYPGLDMQNTPMTDNAAVDCATIALKAIAACEG